MEAADHLYPEAGTRGCMTDRGRALILLGPPPVLRYEQQEVPAWERGREGDRPVRDTRRIVVESWVYPRPELAPALAGLIDDEPEVKVVFVVEPRRAYMVAGERFLELAARAALRDEHAVAPQRRPYTRRHGCARKTSGPGGDPRGGRRGLPPERRDGRGRRRRPRPRSRGPPAWRSPPTSSSASPSSPRCAWRPTSPPSRRRTAGCSTSLVEASRAMDEIFLRQVWAGNPELRQRLAAARGPRRRGGARVLRHQLRPLGPAGGDGALHRRARPTPTARATTP